MSSTSAPRWKLAGPDSLRWEPVYDKRLPHGDHFEMSGRKLSLIVHYEVAADRTLSVRSEAIWPAFRLRQDDVRGYLQRTFTADPTLTIDGAPVPLGPVKRVLIQEGTLNFLYEDIDGIAVRRTLYPSIDSPAFFDRWSFSGAGAARVQLTMGMPVEEVTLYDGTVRIATETLPAVQKGRGAVMAVTIVHHAFRLPGFGPRYDGEAALQARRQRAEALLSGGPRVNTPDPILNAAFRLAKLRASESLFETKMGLVHSPGGGRYYGGVWANDQCEYAGPFFAFSDDTAVHTAAENAYALFQKQTSPEYHALPSSLEVEGDVVWSGAKDRGDAAMIASGASRYALTRGDAAVAERLWPLIAWCLEYCRRKTNAAGVIESDSDELENRFPAGDANLSTACLALDGYRRGADLARALGKTAEGRQYRAAARKLEAAIESHFGATVEGFETYRYYDGNTVLRAWICLPLTVGLLGRAAGTIDALFSPRLWSDDGLATEAGDRVFWDRSTLYALRGVFAAGAPDTALAHLLAYSRRRLLGEHVPYPVEAYPEGGQAHLSAESALYGRIFLEGIFGIVPTGLRSFTLAPRMPEGWSRMDTAFTAFGHSLVIDVRKRQVPVVVAGQELATVTPQDNDTFLVELPV
jgi:hypothetical protein